MISSKKIEITFLSVALIFLTGIAEARQIPGYSELIDPNGNPVFYQEKQVYRSNKAYGKSSGTYYRHFFTFNKDGRMVEKLGLFRKILNPEGSGNDFLTIPFYPWQKESPTFKAFDYGKKTPGEIGEKYFYFYDGDLHRNFRDWALFDSRRHRILIGGDPVYIGEKDGVFRARNKLTGDESRVFGELQFADSMSVKSKTRGFLKRNVFKSTTRAGKNEYFYFADGGYRRLSPSQFPIVSKLFWNEYSEHLKIASPLFLLLLVGGFKRSRAQSIEIGRQFLLLILDGLIVMARYKLNFKREKKQMNENKKKQDETIDLYKVSDDPMDQLVAKPGFWGRREIESQGRDLTVKKNVARNLESIDNRHILESARERKEMYAELADMSVEETRARIVVETRPDEIHLAKVKIQSETLKHQPRQLTPLEVENQQLKEYLANEKLRKQINQVRGDRSSDEVEKEVDAIRVNRLDQTDINEQVKNRARTIIQLVEEHMKNFKHLSPEWQLKERRNKEAQIEKMFERMDSQGNNTSPRNGNNGNHYDSEPPFEPN